MSPETLISTYGYLGLVIGVFVEGETALVLGGFAASLGYLQLPAVMIAAFFAAIFSDQLYFYIGRSKGRSFVDKRPGWKARAERVYSLLDTHQSVIILGAQFLYGFRTVIPFAFGASGMSPLRYLIFNALATLIWVLVVGGLGYLFGQTMNLLIGDIKRYEMMFFLGLGALGAVIWLGSFLVSGIPANRRAGL